ncbi:unnamed protein product, partial [Brenthis ino]
MFKVIACDLKQMFKLKSRVEHTVITITEAVEEQLQQTRQLPRSAVAVRATWEGTGEGWPGRTRIRYLVVRGRGARVSSRAGGGRGRSCGQRSRGAAMARGRRRRLAHCRPAAAAAPRPPPAHAPSPPHAPPAQSELINVSRLR